MSVLGLFTSEGISRTIHAQNNDGFKIYPESFSISRDFGALLPSRTSQNSGTWFTAPISGRNVVDHNTLKFICTIPPESSLVLENVKEICLFAKDANGVDFLLAVGQPTEEIVYDPTGTVTLELQISLSDVDLTSIYVFKNTKAVEIDAHATDPNAHPEIMEVLSKYGITVEGGSYAKERMGQPIEFPVHFDGTKATFTHDGVVWTAKYNGTELNGKNIVFDGIKSNDEIRADFNALNYPNTIEHDGTGTAVSVAGTKTLVGGTYLVSEKDLVYKDADGIYKRAYADGSAKSRLSGVAYLERKLVVGHGFVDINSGLPSGTPLYLSGTTAGKITNFNTNISIGVSLGDHIFFTGYAGDASTDASQLFDAVVTDASGVGQFPTTQMALDFVPNNGRILVKKMELVKKTINTGSKNITIVANHVDAGWKRFLGQATIFNVTFSGVPTQGSFRIEWEDQETNDIPWNATASLVQTEFNQLSGHNGFTVTGDFISGFTFKSNDLQIYPLPTFNYAGRNEIQKFEFSAVPNDGTIRFSFNGQETINHAYNDTIEQLQSAFDALTTTKAVKVTGSFAVGYTIEFIGGWLQDGHKEQNYVKAVSTTDLTSNLVPVLVNGVGSTDLPVDAYLVQKGKTPASNLYDGINLLSMATNMVQLGEEVGPDRLMNVSSPMMKIEGMGLIEDFREGFVLDNANSILTLQARTLGVDKPVLLGNKLPTVNYDIELADYAKDVVAELRLTEHPAKPKRAIVSGIDFKLPSGITLAKTLDSLKAVFTGAEIDFSTGKVYGKDGITDIGIDFNASPITPTKWRWYSVNFIVSGSISTNEATANLLIIPSNDEGDTKELAPKAPVDDYPIGLVAIRGALGEKHKVEITTVKDHVTAPLAGKTFILNHPAESVAFWFSDPSLNGNPPALALTATRHVEIKTLVAGDFQATVAQKIQTAIDADIRFVATVSGNKVVVENADLGDVADASMGDTGFFVKTLVDGTNTDASGIDDVKNTNILQFSTGSGTGGGIGIGDIFLEDLKYELKDSYFSYLDVNIFQKNKEKKLVVRGGRYVTTKKHWELNAGETFTSVDHLDADFKDNLSDLEQIALTLNYSYNAQDTNPVVEVSRDGGANFQVVKMDKDDSGIRHGKHTFTNEPTLAVLNEYDLLNESSYRPLSTTNHIEIGQEFVTGADTYVYRKLTAYLHKLGAPLGTISIKIVKDNNGVPSRNDADVVWVSNPISVSGLASGDITYTVEVKGCVLAPNTKYHMVWMSDDAYKNNFVANTNEIRVRSDNTSPTIAVGKNWNGTAWSNSTQASIYKLEGRVLDLRVRITSSVNGTGIIGYGIFYGLEAQPSAQLERSMEIHHFSGSLNKNSFVLTEFLPNPEFLEVTLSQTGQLWKYPAFEISGNTVIFPENAFNIPNETLTLRFDQTKGGTYDNSDRNLNLLTENHLGSQDASLDKSVAGRGLFLRRPDGTLREICIDDADNIVVYST